VLLLLAGLCVARRLAELQQVRVNVTSNNCGLMELDLDSAAGEQSICREVLKLFAQALGVRLPLTHSIQLHMVLC